MSSRSDLCIRVYRPEDHEQVVALNRYGLAAAGVPLNADVYAGDLDDGAGAYREDRAVLLVGELDGTVVAMGALRPVDGDSCEILRMRVDPGWQGRGFGRTILTALEDHACRFGYTRATLLTGPDQHPALDLYVSAGYQQVAVETHGSLAGVRLTKDLVLGRDGSRDP